MTSLVYHLPEVARNVQRAVRQSCAAIGGEMMTATKKSDDVPRIPQSESEAILETLDTSQPIHAGSRDEAIAIWLARTSITTLRISLGAVFFLFGLLKLFDNVSPAERISVRTVEALTFDLISGDVARIAVAVMEVSIGVLMISGRFQRLALALLAVAMIGILAPLALFPEELFSGKFRAPTLLGQYVIKDIVLLTAGFVISARVFLENTPPGRQSRSRNR